MRFSQALVFGLFGAASAQVSAVLSDLATIKTETAALASALQSYSGGITAAVPILKASTKLKGTIDQATTDANNAGTVSESDQAMVLSAVESLYPTIISSLQAYAAASSKFGAAKSSAVQTLQSIQSSTDKLSAALSSKATGQYKTIAGTITTDIDNAFKSALAGTSPQAATLPPVPSAGGSSGSSSSAAASSASASASAMSSKMAMTSKMAATTTAMATSAPAAMSSTAAPAPGYSGAANKLAGPVGGAVLIAAAAFAL